MSKPAAGKRNLDVERAVGRILARLDSFINGERLGALPGPAARAAAEGQLQNKAGSVRLASLFFAFYAVENPAWDRNRLPKGLRGEFGDKLLSTGLGQRHITLHNSITSFGENLGWKGDVTSVRLENDASRFAGFSKAMRGMTVEELALAADYMAMRFAESRRVATPLPPVSDSVLTYARARQLFHTLAGIPSEGNIQQFLVAALLKVHRSRYGYEIRTHHVHASDKFDGTAGDIEEVFEGRLQRAFEVTVRPDWKNRVLDFKAKMDAANLQKYTIIASKVNKDEDFAEPASMIRFLTPYGRDIAVVDLSDFLHVFAAELTAEELRRAVNQAYDYLATPKLCGRDDIMRKFSEAVSEWLDRAGEKREPEQSCFQE